MRVAVFCGVVCLGLGCGSDDDDGGLGDLPSAGRGGGGSGSAGSGGSSGTTVATVGGEGGEGSEGGSVDPGLVPEAPEVTSFSPEQGDYGALVTIEGTWLGSALRDGVVLAVGDQREVELYPDSAPEVVSWSETRIEFRYPYPATGAVVLETPQGSVVAGEFEPSWVVQSTMADPPTAGVLASVATGPLTVAVLFDSTPPRLIEIGPEGGSELVIDAGDAAPSSLRLYLDGDGVLQGFGLSDEADPEIIALTNEGEGEGGELTASATGIVLGATEYATAGGPDGAVVWLRRDDGWRRARPNGGVWAIDKGPVADPYPDEPLHASGVSSDGALYVAYGVDTGSLFDDMETPYVVRLGPASTEFGSAFAGGHSTDDYLTSLSLEGRGRGVVVHYCGSDVDPFGASSTDYVCFRSLLPSEANARMGAPREGDEGVHAMTKSLGFTSHCEDDEAYYLRESTDDDMDPGEAITFTCRVPVALELDQNDEPIFLMRDGDGTLRSLIRRATK